LIKFKVEQLLLSDRY